MSELLALGISHKTAPLELRERLALTEGRAAGVIRELVEAPEVQEAAAISTCNRTELYMVAPDSVAAESLALGVLAREAEIRPTELVGHLYSLRAADGAAHLFRVTAGLDSMIIGEAEVQGQVKRAYELALVEGATGPILNRLFRGALAAGKRARSETGISEKGLSVPSVAVELAQRALGDLSSRLVLVVGAGETAELTARALAARGVEPAFIANRRYDRAIGLAQRFGGRAVRFEELPAQMEQRRHRGRLDQLSPPRDRARGAGRGDDGARGPAAAPDRPRGATRHPPRLPRGGRGEPARHGRPADAGGAKRLGPRGRGPPGRDRVALRAGPLRALACLAGRRPHRGLAARASRRDRRSRAGRERVAVGGAERGRPGAHAGDGAGDREPAAPRAHPALEALLGRGRRLCVRPRPPRAVRPRRAERAAGGSGRGGAPAARRRAGASARPVERTG